MPSSQAGEIVLPLRQGGMLPVALATAGRRDSHGFRTRIDDRGVVRLDIRPGVEQAERMPREDGQPSREQAAARGCRDAQHAHARAQPGAVGRLRRAGRMRDPDRVARQPSRIDEGGVEAHGLAGESAPCGCDRHLEPGEVAERMHDRHHGHRREQEGEHEPEAECVVDRSAQHDEQHEREEQAVPRGQQEDPALGQADRRGLAAAAIEQPVSERPPRPPSTACGLPHRSDHVHPCMSRRSLDARPVKVRRLRRAGVPPVPGRASRRPVPVRAGDGRRPTAGLPARPPVRHGCGRRSVPTHAHR